MTSEPGHRITGRVAKILSTRELVINRGTADGVTVGMHFAVLDSDPSEIVDPDTREVLGNLPRPKIRVQVVRSAERFSVARTYRSRRVNVGGMGFDLSSSRFFAAPRYVTRYETFKADESAWEPLDETDSFVKVGDPIEQILGEEEETHTPVSGGTDPEEP